MTSLKLAFSSTIMKTCPNGPRAARLPPPAAPAPPPPPMTQLSRAAPHPATRSAARSAAPSRQPVSRSSSVYDPRQRIDGHRNAKQHRDELGGPVQAADRAAARHDDGIPRMQLEVVHGTPGGHGLAQRVPFPDRLAVPLNLQLSELGVVRRPSRRHQHGGDDGVDRPPVVPRGGPLPREPQAPPNPGRPPPDPVWTPPPPRGPGAGPRRPTPPPRA